MIGVFDSGLGGLTVVREIFRQLPGYGVVYFGDTARTPYGAKSKQTIERFALEDARFLLDQGAKVIVVACNTASALAMDALYREVDVPIFEVVSPAVDRAVAVTRGGVGIIGTRGTVASGVYERLIKEADPTVAVSAEACPLFVPLVEEGWHGSPEARSIAEHYLAPLRSKGVDTLILGCTHYPFLRPIIGETVGAHVQLVDPAQEAVSALKAFFRSEPDLAAECRGDAHRFFASDRTPQFARLASEWLGTDIALAETRFE